MGLAGLSVQGFRFRVSGLEFRVWGFGRKRRLDDKSRFRFRRTALHQVHRLKVV